MSGAGTGARRPSKNAFVLPTGFKGVLGGGVAAPTTLVNPPSGPPATSGGNAKGPRDDTTPQLVSGDELRRLPPGRPTATSTNFNSVYRAGQTNGDITRKAVTPSPPPQATPPLTMRRKSSATVQPNSQGPSTYGAPSFAPVPEADVFSRGFEDSGWRANSKSGTTTSGPTSAGAHGIVRPVAVKNGPSLAGNSVADLSQSSTAAVPVPASTAPPPLANDWAAKVIAPPLTAQPQANGAVSGAPTGGPRRKSAGGILMAPHLAQQGVGGSSAEDREELERLRALVPKLQPAPKSTKMNGRQDREKPKVQKEKVVPVKPIVIPAEPRPKPATLNIQAISVPGPASAIPIPVTRSSPPPSMNNVVEVPSKVSLDLKDLIVSQMPKGGDRRGVNSTRRREKRPSGETLQNISSPTVASDNRKGGGTNVTDARRRTVTGGSANGNSSGRAADSRRGEREKKSIATMTSPLAPLREVERKPTGAQASPKSTKLRESVASSSPPPTAAVAGTVAEKPTAASKSEAPAAKVPVKTSDPMPATVPMRATDRNPPPNSVEVTSILPMEKELGEQHAGVLRLIQRGKSPPEDWEDEADDISEAAPDLREEAEVEASPALVPLVAETDGAGKLEMKVEVAELAPLVDAPKLEHEDAPEVARQEDGSFSSSWQYDVLGIDKDAYLNDESLLMEAAAAHHHPHSEDDEDRKGIDPLGYDYGHHILQQSLGRGYGDRFGSGGRGPESPIGAIPLMKPSSPSSPSFPPGFPVGPGRPRPASPPKRVMSTTSISHQQLLNDYGFSAFNSVETPGSVVANANASYTGGSFQSLLSPISPGPSSLPPTTVQGLNANGQLNGRAFPEAYMNSSQSGMVGLNSTRSFYYDPSTSAAPPVSSSLAMPAFSTSTSVSQQQEAMSGSFMGHRPMENFGYGDGMSRFMDGDYRYQQPMYVSHMQQPQQQQQPQHHHHHHYLHHVSVSPYHVPATTGGLGYFDSDLASSRIRTMSTPAFTVSTMSGGGPILTAGGVVGSAQQQPSVSIATGASVGYAQHPNHMRQRSLGEGLVGVANGIWAGGLEGNSDMPESNQGSTGMSTEESDRLRIQMMTILNPGVLTCDSSAQASASGSAFAVGVGRKKSPLPPSSYFSQPEEAGIGGGGGLGSVMGGANGSIPGYNIAHSMFDQAVMRNGSAFGDMWGNGARDMAREASYLTTEDEERRPYT
ncbi:hypothetical protein HK101_008704 [Irineochytrium annulatum]|nr:hypothetical protein HK101_008704 [Irineochytrium annulatum]